MRIYFSQLKIQRSYFSSYRERCQQDRNKNITNCPERPQQRTFKSSQKRNSTSLVLDLWVMTPCGRGGQCPFHRGSLRPWEITMHNHSKISYEAATKMIYGWESAQNEELLKVYSIGRPRATGLCWWRGADSESPLRHTLAVSASIAQPQTSTAHTATDKHSAAQHSTATDKRQARHSHS